MDSRKFRCFKRLFEAFGFERFKKNYKLTNYWFGFHAIAALLQFIVVMKYSGKVLYTYDVIGAFSDYVKFLLTFGCYFFAIYVSWANRESDENITNHIGYLNYLMENIHKNVDDVHEKCYKSFRRKFAFVITFHLIGVAQTFLFQSEETQSVRSLIVFFLPIAACYVKQFHSLFFFDLMNNYFEVLNDQFQELNVLIKCNENYLRNRNYNKFLFKRLKLLRNFHATLFNLKELENKRMGPFYFVNQINFYIHILSSLYWIAFRFFNQKFNPAIC